MVKNYRKRRAEEDAEEAEEAGAVEAEVPADVLRCETPPAAVAAAMRVLLCAPRLTRVPRARAGRGWRTRVGCSRTARARGCVAAAAQRGAPPFRFVRALTPLRPHAPRQGVEAARLAGLSSADGGAGAGPGGDEVRAAHTRTHTQSAFTSPPNPNGRASLSVPRSLYSYLALLQEEDDADGLKQSFFAEQRQEEGEEDPQMCAARTHAHTHKRAQTLPARTPKTLLSPLTRTPPCPRRAG
jgi:hypothetical protein